MLYFIPTCIALFLGIARFWRREKRWR